MRDHYCVQRFQGLELGSMQIGGRAAVVSADRNSAVDEHFALSGRQQRSAPADLPVATQGSHPEPRLFVQPLAHQFSADLPKEFLSLILHLAEVVPDLADRLGRYRRGADYLGCPANLLLYLIQDRSVLAYHESWRDGLYCHFSAF